MSADAYRKALRAYKHAAQGHADPVVQATLATAYTTVSMLLVAEDPAALEAVLSEPFDKDIGPRRLRQRAPRLSLDRACSRCGSERLVIRTHQRNGSFVSCLDCNAARKRRRLS